MSQPTSSTSRLGLSQSRELSQVEKKSIFLESGPRVLKERTSSTPQQAMMRFPSQPSGDQDERSWTPNEVDGPRTRPEKPGMRITGRCASRDGSASSRSMPTGIRSLEAGRSKRNPGPGQVLRFPPGLVTGARRLDPKLDESLFSLEPPQGYAFHRVDLNEPNDKDDGSPEAAVAKLLRGFAEKSAGVSQSDLTTGRATTS